MNKEKIIRKIETKFIKEKLIKGENLLVIGEKGVGKTTIIKQAIKQASKKILQIDLMELQSIDNLSYYLSFKGKNYLFFKKFLKNKIRNIKNINNFNLTKWILMFISLIIFILIFFISGFIILILRKRTKKIIHFHEMNFINDSESKEKAIKIILKIQKIYKNHLLIFEHDQDFDKKLKYKFNLKEIHLKPIDKWFLIDNLFKKLKKEFKNVKIKEKLLKELEDSTNLNNWYIKEIIYKLSYKTFKNIIDDFKDLYISHKQKINLLDFLILNFLQLKHSNLYYELMKEKKYNELTDNNLICSFDGQQEKINQKSKEDFLEKMKSIIPKVAIYIESIILSPNSENKKMYSFFNPKNKPFYFSILNDFCSKVELMEKFKNEPLDFLNEMNKYDISEIESFKFIEDKEIIEFLDTIEKYDSNKLLNFFLKKDVFLSKEVFYYLKKIILETRKDAKKFFDSLSTKYKYYFFSYSLFQLDEELLKNKNKFIPFKTKYMPKNLPLIGNKCNDKIIFDYPKYCKNIIKSKNKFLILLYYQGFINDDKFFEINDNLSISEKSFLVKCFDEFNQNMPKNKKWKIKN